LNNELVPWREDCGERVFGAGHQTPAEARQPSYASDLLRFGRAGKAALASRGLIVRGRFCVFDPRYRLGRSGELLLQRIDPGLRLGQRH
jgi:hypothetical protein